MPEHHHRLPLEEGEAAHDGEVVAEDAVTVKLDEVVEEQLVKVQRVGPLRVAGDLRPLPGAQAPVDALLEAAQPLLQLGGLVSGGRLVLGCAQLRDARFQFKDRLLELKLVRHTPR